MRTNRFQHPSILGDEPIVGKRRVGHLVTLDLAKNKLSINSQVSLFNMATYSIILAKNYEGKDFIFSNGSYFDIANMDIYELIKGDRITPENITIKA